MKYVVLVLWITWLFFTGVRMIRDDLHSIDLHLTEALRER